MRVVLFDIDGTLLLSGGAGRLAMEAALRQEFGTVGPDSYRYDGKTDRLIVRETMRLEGFDDRTIDQRMPAVMALYLEGLRAALANGARRAYTLPGVQAIVDAVDAADDLVLGLLTGNVVEGAELKLSAAGLAPRRFRVGAFGSDHEDRPMLPAFARDRASALLGEQVPGERLVIIGDTPADVQCGRGVGARAIAVATGGFTVEELNAHAPAAAFRDLTETERVLDAIRHA
ncbi:MAG: haloacid dehalogenase-like hydrolase [Gemmatimonadales bacterium]|nr:HAD family hydrolase [Gemmatimonadota bacterium]MCL4215028.1 haloacid dehalogenase-like hydrolase [Gemmatimonadales bacterium]